MRIPILCAAAALAFAPPAAAQTPGGRCGDNLAPAEPSRAITAAEICATVAILAADSFEGREAGTPGADRAAEWIAGRFESLGLEPLGASFLHPFPFSAAAGRDPHGAPPPEEGASLETANVIGLVRGTDPALAEEAVVVGAHYDHLGMGGPGSLAPGTVAIHNGADDNASGVAAVLEIAAALANEPPRRTVLFVAFGGEERGALGSQNWIASPPWPLAETVAMVNLDMVGRLRDSLTVFGTGSSDAWAAILDGAASEGPPVRRVPDGVGPSDHAPFYLAEVPVLALFTGAHEQYHRPEDDAAAIEGEGAARVAAYAARLVRAVADSAVELAWVEAPTTQRTASPFRVALGVVPDYGFAGPGLKLSSVRSGGPAAAAGLAAGDVVVRLAGRAIADVYAYTEALSALEADVPVEVVYVRGGVTIEAEVTPAAR